VRTIDYSLIDTQGGLRPILKEFADSLFPCVANRLAVPVSDLKKGLQVRLRPARYSTEVNADVNRSDSLININESLMIFYHKMLKVFVSTLDVRDLETKVLYKATIPWRRVVRVTRELLQALMEDRILLQKGFRLEELTQNQENVLGLLRDGCEKFSIAHELGHVIIARSRGKVHEYFSANEEVVGYLKPRDSMRGYEKQVIEPWTNELCADLIGLKLLLSLPPEEGDGKYYKSWLASGAVISGELRWMLEDYEARLKQEFTPSITHPPEFLRAKYLNSFIAKEIPNEPNYSANFFYFGMRVLDAIFPKQNLNSPINLD
jgi:hypothetical protein